MGGSSLKNWIFWFTIILIFAGTVLYGQESIEQYLQNIDGPSTEDYLRLLYQGGREDKLLAINILAKSGSTDAKVIEALISSLQEGTFFVKRKAGKIINDFWDVRARSAEVLGDIGDPCTLDGLYMALLLDHDPVVRNCVATAIGKIGQPESIIYLSHAIETSKTNGSDDIVILSCVNALGEIGHKDAFLPLYKVVRGSYRRNITLAARDALKKLQWE